MEHSNRYDGIHPRVVQFVRYHARKLARHRAMPGMELEDYEQDLITDLIAREPRFDSARAAYPTFADRVIRHRVSTLIYLGLRGDVSTIKDRERLPADRASKQKLRRTTAHSGPRIGARCPWISSASFNTCRNGSAVAAHGCWPTTGGRPLRHWGCTTPLCMKPRMT